MMLPPIRTEASAVAIESSQLASRYLSTKAFRLAESRPTLTPICISHGDTA